MNFLKMVKIIYPYTDNITFFSFVYKYLNLVFIIRRIL